MLVVSTVLESLGVSTLDAVFFKTVTPPLVPPVCALCPGVVLLVSVGDQQVAVRRGQGVRSNFDDGTARLIISQLTQAVRNKQR